MTTFGATAHAVLAAGNGNTITNSGLISTTANAAFGVVTGGTGNTVTNSGTIRSFQSYSVFMSGANATLNLNAGTVILGDVIFDTTASAAINFGPGLNIVLHTDNSIPGTITAPNGSYFVNGDNIIVFDLTPSTSIQQGVNQMSGMITNVVGGRFFQPTPRGPATLGPVLSTKGSPADNWVQMFGGFRADPETATTGSFWSANGGVVVGRDTDDGSGFFVGAGVGRASSCARSFDTQGTSVFGGAYTTTSLLGLDANVMLNVGGGFSPTTEASPTI